MSKTDESLLADVVSCIREIDLACDAPMKGIECGLSNVRFQFRAAALKKTGKKLTEETLIAWLIVEKLWEKHSLRVLREEPFGVGLPGKKCDLVIPTGQDTKLWLEIKLAWKAWFNCSMRPTWSNSSFGSYLTGGIHK